MGKRKQWAGVMAVAQKYGFEFMCYTKNGHLKFRHIRTGQIITTGSTPSCRRALMEFEKDCRRMTNQQYQLTGV